MSQLSAEERKMVEDFATQIDITDSNTIMTYGAATQQKMADFSNKALDNVRTKDMGEVGADCYFMPVVNAVGCPPMLLLERF